MTDLKATRDLLEILEQNPGADEERVRAYLRTEYGSSNALTEALSKDLVVRAGDKLYRADDEPNPNDAESARRDRGLPARDGTSTRRNP